ncbi:MAG: hypothetical protein AB7I04_09450 [Pseudomonadales bacterium]
MRIDDLDRHLPDAGSLHRAAVPLGMYLAWCGNLHLLSAGFQQTHELALTRLRYRDLSPAEFLTACSGGHLDAADLSDEGRAFTEAYYADYLSEFRETFGCDPYDVSDDWPHYDRIAPVLTRHLMAWKQGERRSGHDAPRKWWQVWR